MPQFCARANAMFVRLTPAACPKKPFICRHSRRIIVRVLADELDEAGRIQFVEAEPLTLCADETLAPG